MNFAQFLHFLLCYLMSVSVSILTLLHPLPLTEVLVSSTAFKTSVPSSNSSRITSSNPCISNSQFLQIPYSVSLPLLDHCFLISPMLSQSNTSLLLHSPSSSHSWFLLFSSWTTAHYCCTLLPSFLLLMTDAFLIWVAWFFGSWYFDLLSRTIETEFLFQKFIWIPRGIFGWDICSFTPSLPNF